MFTWRIVANVDAEMFQAVQRLREELGLSYSATIRLLIAEAIKERTRETA